MRLEDRDDSGPVLLFWINYFTAASGLLQYCVANGFRCQVGLKVVDTFSEQSG